MFHPVRSAKAALRVRYRRLWYRDTLRFFRRLAADWDGAPFIAEADRRRHRFGFIKAMRGIYLFGRTSRVVTLVAGLLFLASFMGSGATALFVLPAEMTGGFADEDVSLLHGASGIAAFVGPLLIWYIIDRLIALVSVLFWFTEIGTRNVTFYLTSMIAIVLSLILLAGFPSLFPTQPDWVYMIVRRMSVGLLAFAVTTVISLTILTYSVAAVRGRSEALFPVSHMIDRLFRVARRLHRAGSMWIDIDRRSQIASEIDAAASISRRYLFQKFASEDRATIAWKLRQGQRIAAALAEKETWLMTPKADTLDVVLNSVSGSLVALVSGNWDALEFDVVDDSLDVPQEPKTWRQIARGIFGFMRTLVVALLPGALLIIAGRFNLTADLNAETVGWVKVGAFIWIVFVLMFTLDPQLKEKISALKEVTSIFRPGDKKD
jgi:hypothetical protein